MKRPITTLFLLQSLDGKISTGPTDNWDVDKDIPNIKGNPSSGLHQYYEAELETDLWSMNSGRIMDKIGINKTDKYTGEKTPVFFVVLDNNHLTKKGVTFLAKKHNKLIICTKNKNHPVYSVTEDNIQIIEYDGKLKMDWLLHQLYLSGCREITVQTGSTINSVLLREHLIDKVNVVICPILVGGTKTSSLIGGEDVEKLSDIGVLELKEVKKLKNSYIEVFYNVVNNKTESSDCYNELL